MLSGISLQIIHPGLLNWYPTSTLKTLSQTISWPARVPYNRSSSLPSWVIYIYQSNSHTKKRNASLTSKTQKSKQSQGLGSDPSSLNK